MLSLSGVSKSYGGLRPLRIRTLSVQPGDIVGLSGFDEPMAEVFVNLVTGATLPETGAVEIFGRRTSEITESADWLQIIDRFGIVSRRVVLLEEFTVAQNVAMPLTLDVEPVPEETRPQVESLVREAGLGPEWMERQVAGLGEAAKHRVRLARALALDPELLLVEHPVAGVEADAVEALASDLQRAAEARRLSMIVLAAEPAVTRPFARRVLALDAATGTLRPPGTGLIGRLLGRGE